MAYGMIEEEIFAGNSKVSREEVERVRELVRKLQESGTGRTGYDLAPPFGGRRVSTGTSGSDDPKLVRLRHSRADR